MPDWTLLFYVVAEPPLLSTVPSKYRPLINAKAQALTDAITANLTADMVAAIRTVWDGPHGPGGCAFSAEAFNTPGAVNVYSASQFPKPPGPFVPGTTNTLNSDLREFFRWARTTLPATPHCAVFFWGHSFGPAGLFEPRGALELPNEADAGFVLPVGSTTPGRHDDKSTCAAMSEQTCLNVEAVRAAVAATFHEVDIVMFQDCWMSTLETACQLSNAWPLGVGANQGVCKYIIASQSELPIGGVMDDPSKTGIWPFDELLPALAVPEDEWQVLFDFYGDTTLWDDLVSLPLTLLSMADVPNLTSTLKLVVADIQKDDLLKAAAFANAYIFESDLTTGELHAGSDELIDLTALLKNVIDYAGETSPVGLRAANAIDAVASVVRRTDEWYLTKELGFSGLGAMGGTSDFGGKAQGYIRTNLRSQFYKSLISSQQSSWDELVFV